MNAHGVKLSLLALCSLTAVAAFGCASNPPTAPVAAVVVPHHAAQEVAAPPGGEAEFTFTPKDVEEKQLASEPAPAMKAPINSAKVHQ